jgi:hypothetical protein
MKEIFRDMFEFSHILTPIAVEHFRLSSQKRSFKILYIFGIRIAYWSTVKHD